MQQISGFKLNYSKSGSCTAVSKQSCPLRSPKGRQHTAFLQEATDWHDLKCTDACLCQMPLWLLVVCLLLCTAFSRKVSQRECLSCLSCLSKSQSNAASNGPGANFAIHTAQDLEWREWVLVVTSHDLSFRSFGVPQSKSGLPYVLIYYNIQLYLILVNINDQYIKSYPASETLFFKFPEDCCNFTSAELISSPTIQS